MGWLGIVALLSNLLVGVLGHAPAKAGVVVDALGPLLCTSEGLQTAPRGGGPDRPGGDEAYCTACALLAGFALATAATLAVASVLLPTRILNWVRSGARTLADHLSLGGIRSRAPPLAA
jgi:hypothetical protein